MSLNTWKLENSYADLPSKLYTSINPSPARAPELVILNEKLAKLVKVETYKPEPNLMWNKMFAAKKMKGRQLDVVKRLAAWRELTARQRNRPRKWILTDYALIEIAKQLPKDKAALLKIDKVGEKTVSRYGDNLLNLLHDN